MSTDQARRLVAEAYELQGQGKRKERTWTELRGPITERVTQAVKLAPKDAYVLFMATRLLTPFTAIDGNAKRLVREYQDRLDRLGGPSNEVIELAGGRENYERHRRVVKESAGAGCLVAVMAAVVLTSLIAGVIATG